MTPGDVLGSTYELESRLGKGGMGEVWRARHLITNERVAVKVLLADLAQDAALQKRFLREARAAAAVKHPNVVELREVQQGEDGAPFLVMELLTGETLGRRLRRKGTLSVGEAAAIFLPVFDAVEAAHAVGLVHRDLKPENIFLAHDGGGVSARVRVLDFGIAKQVEKLATPSASSAAATAPAETTAAMLGTPYYMAPEQALGERDIDGRADIWSLGVVLYECLSGRRPTEAATLGAILKIIVTDGVVPIRSVLPEIDGELADSLMQMLRTGRDARAPSLDAIRERLSALRDPAYVLETETDEGIPASIQRPPPQEAPGARSARRPGFKALPWIGGTALAGLGIALAVRSLGAPAPAPAPAISVAPVVAESARSPVAPSSEPSVASAVPSGSGLATASASASGGRARVPVVIASAMPAIVSASSATPGGAPSRGPSGLVTDNPFGGPTPSASR